MKLNVDVNLEEFPPLCFFFVSSSRLIFPDFIGDHFVSLEHFLRPLYSGDQGSSWVSIINVDKRGVSCSPQQFRAW